jgi:CheY-like chemotaxis protein
VRVLIADDDRVSRELLLRLLAQWGYEPVAAGSGEEA